MPTWSVPDQPPTEAGAPTSDTDVDPATPYLPAARIVSLPGRGETFVRVGEQRPGRPTVLLLHGWLASADLNWFALYEPLAAGWNVIALDHRGHGRGLRTNRPFALEAAADDAAAVLDTLGDELAAEPLIACGYSMGGPIALFLARRRPDLVQGLVLAATALEWNRRRTDRLLWRTLGAIGVALRLGGDTKVANRIIDDMAAGDDLVARYRSQLLAEAKRLNSTDAIGAGRALSRFDGQRTAEALRLPAAVVATRRDRLVRPHRQVALAEALGAVRFDLEADHDVFIRQPRLWADSVIEALGSVAARLR